jgi:hypothetical protein
VTDAKPLRAFVSELLSDVGAEVRDEGGLLWVRVPEELQQVLEVSANLCLTFDSARVGEFGAELVAPGSYLLERLLGLATRRGRWDTARLEGVSDDWVAKVLEAAFEGAGRAWSLCSYDTLEGRLFLFAFRTTLTSDEKRESFRLVAVPEAADGGWEIDFPLPGAAFVPAVIPDASRGLEAAYRVASEILRDLLREELESFRGACLAALEKEVRQIFRFFDGTVQEIRDAAPSGAGDIIRTVETERDRRLAEALERFEPHGIATLCSVRVLSVPMVRVLIRPASGGEGHVVWADAWTRKVRSFPPSSRATGYVPLRAGPRSDTPRRRSSDAPGDEQSLGGSTAQSQAVGETRPVP